VLVEVRLSFLVVPFEITFDDGRHDMVEYGPQPIVGQAPVCGPANVSGIRKGWRKNRDSELGKWLRGVAG